MKQYKNKKIYVFIVICGLMTFGIYAGDSAISSVNALFDRIDEVGPNLVEKNLAYFSLYFNKLNELELLFVERDSQRKKTYKALENELTKLKNSIQDEQKDIEKEESNYDMQRLSWQVKIDTLIGKAKEEIEFLEEEIEFLEEEIEFLEEEIFAREEGIATLKEVNDARVQKALIDFHTIGHTYEASVVQRTAFITKLNEFIDTVLAHNYDFTSETQELGKNNCSKE